MNKFTILVGVLLLNLSVSLHLQSAPNAFTNWANSGQNPAFNNWANGANGARPAQNNAFNNWANTPNENTGTPNNGAFNNWVNQPGNQNPAFNNWANNSTAKPNPAFNNWMNQSGQQGTSNGQNAFNNWNNRPGIQQPQPGTNGQNAFNNWNNRPGVQPGSNGQNAFNNWANNSTVNSNDLDNRLRSFLSQNGINTPVPSGNECMRYSISNTHNNYQVTCSLPNGQKFQQACYGKDNCSMVTCKLSMCSRIPNGGLYRVGF